MCGRYTLRTPLNVLAEQFLFDLGDAQAVPRYNIPPTTEVLAVRHPRELAKFRWGLIPSLGEGRQDRLQHDQCPCGHGRDEAGFPCCLQEAALPACWRTDTTNG